MYSYLIVGKGLFGSAAARYLSQVSNRVALVGPDEPQEWATHKGVFASHYDEARIVSTSAPDDLWAKLDRASIEQYPAIESQSGTPFFTPSSRLSAVAIGDDTAYPYLPDNAVNSKPYSATTFPVDLRYRFPPDYKIVQEDAPSGYLNPRAMVKAQTKIAQKQGATVISELVTHVKPNGNHVEVTLHDGQSLKAEKVLLAGGSFTNCFELINRKLAIKPESVPILLAEVSQDEAKRLKHLPPLNYKTRVAPILHLSILPPLPYPDGRYYVKVVVNSDEDHILPDFDALSRWFRGNGDFAYSAQVQDILQRVLPDVTFHNWQTKPCAVCYTPSGKPMIDCVATTDSGTGQIYIAVGGNVGAAHPSDAIGKLAADLMHGDRWSSHIDRAPFQIAFADEWASWMNTSTAKLR